MNFTGSRSSRILRAYPFINRVSKQKYQYYRTWGCPLLQIQTPIGRPLLQFFLDIFTTIARRVRRCLLLLVFSDWSHGG